MRVPKFLKVIMPVLALIALCRVLNGAGPVYIQPILNSMRCFTFDFDALIELFNYIADGEFVTSLTQWDSALDLFTNLGRVLTGFFNAVGDFFIVVIKGLWNVLQVMISTIAKMFQIIVTIFGFG